MICTRPYEMKERIYQLCNEKQYFTCGTNRQYDRLFYMVLDREFGFYDVALAIWLCSEDADLHEIQEDVANIFADVEKDALEEDEAEEFNIYDLPFEERGAERARRDAMERR